MNLLMKYKSEFARALREHDFEQRDGGLYFPRQGALLRVGGVFSAIVDGVRTGAADNVFVNEGLNTVLNVLLGDLAKPVGIYIAPFVNDQAPVATLTAATFAATQGELTNYTEATRQAWTKDANSTAQSITNSAAPATFTIGVGGATIYGAGLILGASAKSATTGTLAAAALFDAPNTLNANSKLQVEYALSAVSE